MIERLTLYFKRVIWVLFHRPYNSLQEMLPPNDPKRPLFVVHPGWVIDKDTGNPVYYTPVELVAKIGIPLQDYKEYDGNKYSTQSWEYHVFPCWTEFEFKEARIRIVNTYKKRVIDATRPFGWVRVRFAAISNTIPAN